MKILNFNIELQHQDIERAKSSPGPVNRETLEVGRSARSQLLAEVEIEDERRRENRGQRAAHGRRFREVPSEVRWKGLAFSNAWA
jgi:hypothetical protein